MIALFGWRERLGLERLQRFLFAPIDWEQLAQIQNAKDLIKFGIDAAKDQPSAPFFHVLVQDNQPSQHHRA
jgi:hypothetical protein